MVVTTAAMVHALETAPGGALVGLTAPKEGLREVARLEVAACLVAALEQREQSNRDQLRLPL